MERKPCYRFVLPGGRVKSHKTLMKQAIDELEEEASIVCDHFFDDGEKEGDEMYYTAIDSEGTVADGFNPTKEFEYFGKRTDIEKLRSGFFEEKEIDELQLGASVLKKIKEGFKKAKHQGKKKTNVQYRIGNSFAELSLL